MTASAVRVGSGPLSRRWIIVAALAWLAHPGLPARAQEPKAASTAPATQAAAPAGRGTVDMLVLQGQAYPALPKPNEDVLLTANQYRNLMFAARDRDSEFGSSVFLSMASLVAYGPLILLFAAFVFFTKRRDANAVRALETFSAKPEIRALKADLDVLSERQRKLLEQLREDSRS